VLGGRDDVRLGCIRDHDPLARRRVDVDVVDPHSGPADHAQPCGARDHIGRHLRRGADDQRLIAVDDLLERRFGVDDDVESLAQQVDARVRDLLADLGAEIERGVAVTRALEAYEERARV